MDQNVQFVVDARVKRTIENLEKNNISAYKVEDEAEALKKVGELIPEGSSIGIGGSMTLFEVGAIDLIRKGNYEVLDRYKEGLTPAEMKEIFRKGFFADAYLTSSNAVTENGELYNVDGTGNRVAPMIYGPDRVIVIVGINKIVKDIEEAVLRVEETAAPANNKRLSKNNPCTKTGHCMDCSSEGRICNDYVVIRRQGVKGRIHVIIVNKELGY
ncbi:MAG: lactate utilization protein [Clostridiaceae bacterium]|jgi:L-lactate utilization protein LutB|nr:lactate utilization protein [Clostridiaceae bacterium]